MQLEWSPIFKSNAKLRQELSVPFQQGWLFCWQTSPVAQNSLWVHTPPSLTPPLNILCPFSYLTGTQNSAFHTPNLRHDRISEHFEFLQHSNCPVASRLPRSLSDVLLQSDCCRSEFKLGVRDLILHFQIWIENFEFWRQYQSFDN